MVSTYIGATVYLVLIVAIVILTFISLYYFDAQRKCEILNATNPYCLRQVCGPTSNIPALKIAEDPSRFSYQNFNYCLVNGPTCEVQKALDVCVTSGSTTLTSTDINTLAAFYNNEYYPRCQYSWGGGQVTPNDNNSGPNQPNSPNLANGPNDNTLVALVQCGQKLNLLTPTNDLGALKAKCGAACN